jgi:hypothetical protein
MSSRISNISISLLASFTSSLIIGGLPLPAFCQRDYDPNFSHFYMGRQQWSVEDNSPVIINRTGTAPGAMNGALQNRPVPLPKAGWQGYAPVETPTTKTGAAKTPGHSQSSKSRRSATGNKGKAGNLTGGRSPSGIQGYKPYATYPAPVANPNGADLQQTSTHVKGSLLHWARRTPKQE